MSAAVLNSGTVGDGLEVAVGLPVAVAVGAGVDDAEAVLRYTFPV
jgi:hypothetical protein